MKAESSGFSTRLLTAAMEISSLYALATLLFMIPGEWPLPFVRLSGTLLIALFISNLLARMGFRRITTFLVYTFGFLMSLYVVTKAYAGLPFVRSSGLGEWMEAFNRISGIAEWFAGFLLFLVILLFWFRGIRIGSKDPDYSLTVKRFDSCFGILLFTAFILLGFHLPDPGFLRFVLFFMVSGTTALISARSRSHDHSVVRQRSLMSYTLPFIALLLLLGTGFYLLYPLLVQTAEETYAVMQTGAATMRPFLIGILRFIFGRNRGVSSAGAPEANSGLEQEPDIPLEMVDTMGPIGILFFWGIILIIGFGIALLIGWSLLRLLHYLLGRSEKKASTISFRNILRPYISSLRSALHWFYKLFRFKRRSKAAAQLNFRRLVLWGHYSGLPRKPSETPFEYARRLAERFPKVEAELLLIVRSVQQEFYGDVESDKSKRTALKSAFRRLHNPALIPYIIHRRYSRHRTAQPQLGDL